MPDQPDFATMYDASPLAPRMAARLWVVARLAHDAFRQDMADIWLEQLPTVARPTSTSGSSLRSVHGSMFIPLRLAEGLEDLSAEHQPVSLAAT